jgi:hypothetical protein
MPYAKTAPKKRGIAQAMIQCLRERRGVLAPFLSGCG